MKKFSNNHGNDLLSNLSDNKFKLKQNNSLNEEESK